MLLEVRAIEPFFKNGYLVACQDTREGVLIDPGDEARELLSIVERERIAVKYILLTHAHVDHVSGVALARRVLGAPVGLHPDDRMLYERAEEQGLLFGIRFEPLPPVDFYYGSEGPWSFGRFDVRIHHTPGHTPPGECLQVGPAGERGRHLFVGDTLFAGSIGRTDLPGGDHDTLIRSIRNVLFGFGDEAIVYPGHGPVTTIGDERRTNPFLAGAG